MSEILNELKSLNLFFCDRNLKPKDIKKDAKSFIHILSKVKDYRHSGYITYKIESLLGICFIMSIMGKFTSFYYVEKYVKLKPKLFISLGLVKKNEYPSNDTYMRLFKYLDNEVLKEETIERIKRFYERVREKLNLKGKTILSGDGQYIKGTSRNYKDKDSTHAINVLNLYSESNAITLYSIPIDNKTNEIPILQNLLKKLTLNNKIITGDAIHTQIKTIEIINKKKGDYLFTVKTNQPTLYSQITQDFVNKKWKKEFVNKENYDLEIIKLDDIHIAPEWPGARSIIKAISHKRDKRNEVSIEHFFISSLTNKDEIYDTIDKRWEIENGLHRFKDQQLNQDKIQSLDKNTLKNMATLNNVVYALYRLSAAINNKTPNEMKIIYEDNPISLLKDIYPLTIGNNFSKLVKSKMRGTKESKIN